MKQRQISEIRTAHPSRDGDGVAIQRISGMRHALMDPILMIDELSADNREDFAGGFPPHPHRGMQTLTYMKRGGIVHEDSQGNRGEIRGGGAQWMSAGRGIIHSEMPTPETKGLQGFQLWVNLKASEKMMEPEYRDVPKAELTHWQGDGVQAVVIAGHWQLPGAGLTGPLDQLARYASILDLGLESGVQIELPIPVNENLLGYVYDGQVCSRNRQVGARQMLITSEGDRLQIQACAEGAQVLLMRGSPLGEPVANYGPFVMNTSEEIERTLQDYQSGQFP